MSAKAFTARPPGVDPRWWAQASWSAKQRAVRVHRAASRPSDEPEIAPVAPRMVHPELLRSVNLASVTAFYGDTAELGAERLAAACGERYGVPDLPERRETWRDRVPLVDELLNVHGDSPESVAARFGVGLGAVEKGMRRAGRVDLARPFSRVHSQQRRAAA